MFCLGYLQWIHVSYHWEHKSLDNMNKLTLPWKVAVTDWWWILIVLHCLLILHFLFFQTCQSEKFHKLPMNPVKMRRQHLILRTWRSQETMRVAVCFFLHIVAITCWITNFNPKLYFKINFALVNDNFTIAKHTVFLEVAFVNLWRLAIVLYCLLILHFLFFRPANRRGSKSWHWNQWKWRHRLQSYRHREIKKRWWRRYVSSYVLLL